MKVSLPTGITVRTTQLAWSITLATLSIFIIFIVPQQKRDLEEALRSKAQSVAAALHGDLAGAAVSEDYSAVVDKAMQVVAGDPAVEFLVINKNDGYSVLVQRDSWRVESKIDSVWYVRDRVPSSEIGSVPLFHTRAFRYSTPFDYNAIQWGWIHVGLSLRSYDASVHNIYRRTALVALLCIFISLIASVTYARLFAEPILQLRGVVDRVRGGDLSARAQFQRRDEIQGLAEAFNSMADAVLHRDRILGTVRHAAQALQGAPEWQSVMPDVIATLAQATEASRVCLFECETLGEGRCRSRVSLDWAEPGVDSYTGHGALGFVWDIPDARRERLLQGQLIVLTSEEVEASPWLSPAPASLATVIAPVFKGRALWGELVLEECHSERRWSDVELDSVRVIADMLGTSIVRQDAQEALVASKSELEHRVTERTRELRQEIVAKDRAHAELEEAQKRLIELSRLSGMAEVATGVLHNVGNVLNSVNVSANLLTNQLRNSRITQLNDAVNMLLQHRDELSDFLANDVRGQRLLPYLDKLSRHLLDERVETSKELETLARHVGHVKEVVAMQQTYARAAGVMEKVGAHSLVEDRLKLAQSSMERHQIVVKKDFQSEPVIVTDRHKVQQILLNLLRNAKDAVKAGRALPRQIQVGLRQVGAEKVRFEVTDNGVGIAPENLARIFSHGFTTKQDGHGFGLHSGALAATQLGGTLSVASDGPGCGATFTLELPVRCANNTDARIP